MSTIAVGDIHGNLPALEDMLRALRAEAAADDTVVFLGDFIDRGPQSRECVDALLAFRAGVPARVEALELFAETPDCICTHGGLDPGGGPLAAQHPRSLIWGTTQFQDRYSAEPPLVYGHWNNAELDADGWPRPRIIGNTIGIDTIRHGVLTAIRMPERQIIQSARYA